MQNYKAGDWVIHDSQSYAAIDCRENEAALKAAYEDITKFETHVNQWLEV